MFQLGNIIPQSLLNTDNNLTTILTPNITKKMNEKNEVK